MPVSAGALGGAEAAAAAGEQARLDDFLASLGLAGGGSAAAGITGITPLLDENGNVVIDKNN